MHETLHHLELFWDFGDLRWCKISSINSRAADLDLSVESLKIEVSRKGLLRLLLLPQKASSLGLGVHTGTQCEAYERFF